MHPEKLKRKKKTFSSRKKLLSKFLQFLCSEPIVSVEQVCLHEIRTKSRIFFLYNTQYLWLIRRKKRLSVAGLHFLDSKRVSAKNDLKYHKRFFIDQSLIYIFSRPNKCTGLLNFKKHWSVSYRIVSYRIVSYRIVFMVAVQICRTLSLTIA
jgi:hypothetical protein